MGSLSAGQVVFLPFPFSDLSHNKLRPGLLLAHVRRGDWIACQITSNPHADPRAVPLSTSDFVQGGLQRLSYVCPGKLFTAHESLITFSAGLLEPRVLERVRQAAAGIIKGQP